MHLYVGFEERVLLETVMRSRRLMWSDFPMVFFRVYETTLIVFDADQEGCRSGLLQWRPRLRELNRSNHDFSLNVAKV